MSDYSHASTHCLAFVESILIRHLQRDPTSMATTQETGGRGRSRQWPRVKLILTPIDDSETEKLALQDLFAIAFTESASSLWKRVYRPNTSTTVCPVICCHGRHSVNIAYYVPFRQTVEIEAGGDRHMAVLPSPLHWPCCFTLVIKPQQCKSATLHSSYRAGLQRLLWVVVREMLQVPEYNWQRGYTHISMCRSTHTLAMTLILTQTHICVCFLQWLILIQTAQDPNSIHKEPIMMHMTVQTMRG